MLQTLAHDYDNDRPGHPKLLGKGFLEFKQVLILWQTYHLTFGCCCWNSLAMATVFEVNKQSIFGVDGDLRPHVDGDNRWWWWCRLPLAVNRRLNFARSPKLSMCSFRINLEPQKSTSQESLIQTSEMRKKTTTHTCSSGLLMVLMTIV